MIADHVLATVKFYYAVMTVYCIFQTLPKKSSNDIGKSTADANAGLTAEITSIDSVSGEVTALQLWFYLLYRLQSITKLDNIQQHHSQQNF